MKHLGVVPYALFLCLQLPPLLLAADQTNGELSLADRVKHIQRLSKIDRDRLDRNIQVFEEMTDEKKEQYRHLHDELAKDQKQGAVLSTVFENYTQWLHTLSPVQRQQLRSVPDSGRKIALIRQFMEEHDRQVKEEHDRLMKEELNSTRGPSGTVAEQSAPDPRKAVNWSVIQLTKNDIDALMRVILEDLPPDKRSPELESLPLDESWKIVVESAKAKDDFSQWPDEALLKKMIAKLRTPTAMFIVRSANREQSDRENMVRLLLGGIVEQTHRQLRNVSDDQLRTAIEKLSPTEQEKVKEKMESSETPEKKRNWLIDRYLEKNAEGSRRKLRECRSNVLEVFAQLEVEPPPKMMRGGQRK